MRESSSSHSQTGDDGQLYTLEGLAAAAVLLLAMIYALNAFVVSPTSDVNPGTETNQRVADDLLKNAAENTTDTNNTLKEMLLNWNATAGSVGFENSTDGVYYYEGEDPDTGGLEFGEDLQKVLTEEGISYNIDASFTKNNDSTGRIPIVDKGEPTTSALSASRTVVLLDDDEVTKGGGTVDLINTTRYPIPKDPSRSTDVYNQVQVRITVWT